MATATQLCCYYYSDSTAIVRPTQITWQLQRGQPAVPLTHKSAMPRAAQHHEIACCRMQHAVAAANQPGTVAQNRTRTKLGMVMLTCFGTQGLSVILPEATISPHKTSSLQR